MEHTGAGGETTEKEQLGTEAKNDIVGEVTRGQTDS